MWEGIVSKSRVGFPIGPILEISSPALPRENDSEVTFPALQWMMAILSGSPSSQAVISLTARGSRGSGGG